MEKNSYLERAASREAAGRPDEAWEELTRGVRAGDPPCARVMGLRLFLGDRAAQNPQEGLRLLGEACDRGLPEAAARAAGLLALGVGAAPDRALALQWLARAAQGGLPSARGQLLALCEDRALAASAAGNAAADWMSLARAVDLAVWSQAPSPLLHHEAPRVASIAGFTRREVCAVLIALARARLAPAQVYDRATRGDIVVPARSNTEAKFDLGSVELIHVLVQARVAAACGVPERSLEAPAVLHYDPGQQFRDHFDFFDPDSPGASASIATQGQRVMTFLLYLNDDYDGGETAFPELGLSHRGGCGDALFFANTFADGRPDRRSRHAGRPTRRGEKWVVSQFIRGHTTR